MAGLALRHIEKSFGSVRALAGVDFEVGRGQLHALLGENGAGKTTLMRVAYGLEHPDSGTIEIDDRRVVIGSPREARDRGIGMVHQHFTSIPQLTVGENIALAAAWPTRPKLVRDRVLALCDRLALPLDPDARAGTLPVALKQRLEIVKALAGDASILLLDEPTAVLTPDETENLLVFLRRFVTDGGSVVLITHKLGEVLHGADAVTVLRAGQVTFRGPVAGQSAASLAEHMIGGPLPSDESRVASGDAGPCRIDVRDAALTAQPGQGTGLVAGSLTVHEGEVVGIAAVEGNGQRELFRLLAGFAPPEAGTVEVDGPCAYVPEDRTTEGLIPDMSVTENVVLGTGTDGPWVGARRPHLVDWREARRATRALLRDYAITADGPDVPAGSLSGGNQQKAVVARALRAQ